MKPAGLTTLLITLMIAVFSQQAFAANMQFLKNSPARYFTNEDWDIFKNAGREALDDSEDGTAVEWKNNASKNGGVITPVATREVNGQTCRDMRISTYASNGLKRTGTYEFCKQSDGKWKATGNQ
jgi:surface antigen